MDQLCENRGALWRRFRRAHLELYRAIPRYHRKGDNVAFAQLTSRESLRDIEICLQANQKKLYGMGFRSPVRRSTLADANEGRD